MIRVTFSGNITNFLLNDIPNPDNILKICEAIIVARTDKDLAKYLKQNKSFIYLSLYKSEQLLFYELIDLLKSPEVFKSITGSNVETIKMKKSFQERPEK